MASSVPGCMQRAHPRVAHLLALGWQRFQKRGLNTTIRRGARPNTHRSWLGVAGRPSRRPGKPWDTVGPRHAHPPLPLQLLVGSVAKLSGMDRGSCPARVQDRRISPRLSWQISKGALESFCHLLRRMNEAGTPLEQHRRCAAGTCAVAAAAAAASGGGLDTIWTLWHTGRHR